MIGQLIELNKDIAIVTFGNIKSTVPPNKLSRISHNQLKQTQRASVGKRTTEAVRERQLNFKSEITCAVCGRRGFTSSYVFCRRCRC